MLRRVANSGAVPCDMNKTLLPDDSQRRPLGVTAKGTGLRSHICHLQAVEPRASQTTSCACSLGWETQWGLLGELNKMTHVTHGYRCGAQPHEPAASLHFSAERGMVERAG